MPEIHDHNNKFEIKIDVNLNDRSLVNPYIQNMFKFLFCFYGTCYFLQNLTEKSVVVTSFLLLVVVAREFIIEFSANSEAGK